MVRCFRKNANIRDKSGLLTPLHLAAIFGTVDAVNALITAGADVNATSMKDVTPLHMAAELGTAKAVNALINAGADIHSRTHTNATPLHLAANLTRWRP